MVKKKQQLVLITGLLVGGMADCCFALAQAASGDPSTSQGFHIVAEGIQHLANALLIVLGGIFLFVLALRLIEPLQKPETEVSFVDLREKQQQQVDRELAGQALTELVAARLQYILRIHDMAHQYFRDYFKQKEVIDNSNYSDVTSVLEEFDIQPIIIEDPTQLAIRPSIGSLELGQISTKTGPVDASLSLSGIQKLFSKNHLIRFRGSMQNYGGKNRLVGMLANRGKTWGWIIDEKDILDPSSKMAAETSDAWAPELAKELAYHAANRILSETSELIDILPGIHFRIYTDLLKKFTEYLQDNSASLQEDSAMTALAETAKIKTQSTWEQLQRLYHEFHETEPNNIRTYYISYVLAVLSIYKGDYSYAYQLLRNAVDIETTVIASFMTFFHDPTTLGWSTAIVKHYRTKFPRSNAVKRVRRSIRRFATRAETLDRRKAFELAKGLPNVNHALGITLERLAEKAAQPQHPKTPMQYLEEAADAYHRALDFRPNDPLLLSSFARVLIKRADHLSGERIASGENLSLEYQAQEALNIGTANQNEINVKYAFNQKALLSLAKANLKEAVAAYKQAIACDHEFLIAQRNLANAYTLQGNHELAIETLSEALRSAGQSHEPQLNLEYIQAWLHNSRAWAYFSQARMRRISEQDPPATDPDTQKLLDLADNDLDEALSFVNSPDKRDQSISQQLKMVIQVNRFFVWCERQLSVRANRLNANQIRIHVRDNLNEFVGQYSTFLKNNYKSVNGKDYIRVLCGDYLQPPAFAERWEESTVTALDYQMFVMDLGLLHDYLGREFPALLHQDNPDHPWDRTFHSINECLSGSIKLMESQLNPILIGLAYIRHQLPRQALRCWQERIEQLQAKPQNFASNLSLYVCVKLIYFYFRAIDRPEGAGRALDQFRRMQDDLIRQCDAGPVPSLQILNLLREASTLGVTLRENGPLNGDPFVNAMNTSARIHELEAIFLPIDHLFAAVKIARFKAGSNLAASPISP